MRRFAATIMIVLLAACGDARTRGRSSTDAPAETDAPATPGPASTTRDAGDSAAAPGNAPSIVDGAAELRKLVAAGARIMVFETEEDAAASEFTVDSAGTPATWAGDYDFGDSEWESVLSLRLEGNAITATLSYGVLANDTTWVTHEERIDGVTISGATLTAREWSGVFARRHGRPGLIIFRAPAGGNIEPVEFGKKTEGSPDGETS